jgi:hypothetical protein
MVWLTRDEARRIAANIAAAGPIMPITILREGDIRHRRGTIAITAAVVNAQIRILVGIDPGAVYQMIDGRDFAWPAPSDRRALCGAWRSVGLSLWHQCRGNLHGMRA